MKGRASMLHRESFDNQIPCLEPFSSLVIHKLRAQSNRVWKSVSDLLIQLRLIRRILFTAHPYKYSTSKIVENKVAMTDCTPVQEQLNTWKATGNKTEEYVPFVNCQFISGWTEMIIMKNMGKNIQPGLLRAANAMRFGAKVMDLSPVAIRGCHIRKLHQCPRTYSWLAKKWRKESRVVLLYRWHTNRWTTFFSFDYWFTH